MAAVDQDFAISPHELQAAMARRAPDDLRIYDVCLPSDYDGRDWLVPRSQWRDAAGVARWSSDIPENSHVVIVCEKGRKISQAVASQLRRRGIGAAILAGGATAWAEAGLPRVRKHLGLGTRGAPPSRWVTRLRPKIDRIACPWLISRFFDPDAEFHFVEAGEVLAAADVLQAIPYDVDGAEVTHRGEACSFDSLLDDFGLRDPALERLRLIVRGADTGRLDVAPEAAGLLAMSLGVSALAGADDLAAVKIGASLYDALYAWQTLAATETHNWPTRQG